MWGETFRTRLDRPWAHQGSHTMDTVFFHAGKMAPERGATRQPPSSAEVKERVQLYLYALSGPSLPLLGRTLPLRSSYKFLESYLEIYLHSYVRNA